MLVYFAFRAKHETPEMREARLERKRFWMASSSSARVRNVAAQQTAEETLKAIKDLNK